MESPVAVKKLGRMTGVLSMNIRKNFKNCFHFQSAALRQNDKTGQSGDFQSLENDSLHVWSARYSDLGSDFSFVSDFLSKTERNASSGFLNPADSRRYVLRHGMVRYILGSYASIEPELLPLVQDMNGKPGLDPRSAFHELSFSLSHTDLMVSMGIIKNYRIGIDITRPVPEYPFDEICGYLFTPEEQKFMSGIQPGQRYWMFFWIWALKEAIVKATGDGIRMMNKTDVTPVIGEPCNTSSFLLTIDEKPMNFFIYRFSPNKGHLGAAAVCLDGEKNV